MSSKDWHTAEMKVAKSYKFRFYPTTDQESLLARTFGCVRFVWNAVIAAREEAWESFGIATSFPDASALLTDLKADPDLAFLGEVSSVPLQQALRHQQRAYDNFFSGRAGKPRFKRKDDVQSAVFMNNAFTLDKQNLVLAKMKESLNIRWSRVLPKAAKVSSVCVTKDPACRYFVSLNFEDEVSAKSVLDTKVGIDLGVASFATLSTGEKIDAPDFFRKDEKTLAFWQRRLARKKKGSQNRRKARRKVARIHARVADRRHDFLHKLSTRLVNENQVLAFESLSVKNMLKNRHLSKSIADASWSEFLRQIEYKAAWYGRQILSCGRFFPSSKTCSHCGFVLPELSLSVREWTCPDCGATHDRDVNAARNILTAGLAVCACGGSVRLPVPA
ncbi:RNA-guided endonuclease InsQ/TnpB family protein [Leptospirillum ferriphilum]|uniref:Transposase, IS605 OrfB family, central region n=2 Tax=Leptospirillum ferriphilum TaxID=178606 RepID=A0A2I2MGX9_9BACT|nr:RNA-guided endonuclease TnpB family protein [Leptospirillum ferriphilum]